MKDIRCLFNCHVKELEIEDIRFIQENNDRLILMKTKCTRCDKVKVVKYILSSEINLEVF